MPIDSDCFNVLNAFVIVTVTDYSVYTLHSVCNRIGLLWNDCRSVNLYHLIETRSVVIVIVNIMTNQRDSHFTVNCQMPAPKHLTVFCCVRQSSHLYIFFGSSKSFDSEIQRQWFIQWNSEFLISNVNCK